MLPVKILKKMKVFITGATGLIGSQLSRRIIERGDSVTVLTRDAARAKNKLGDAVKCVSSLGDMENLDAFDAVINLCGENIGDKRWTPLQKSLIENSRWHPTEKIAELIRRGVDLRLLTPFEGLSAEGELKVLTTARGAIPADMAVIALGVTPDTALAAAAGLALGQKGSIVTDSHMRTSDPDIYAVGDAVEVRHFVTGARALVSLAGPANKQGRIAADNICGGDSEYMGSQGSSVIKVFSLTAASTGINEKTARAAGIAYEKVVLSPAHHASYYPGAQIMTMKVLYERGSLRILGAQIVGGAGVDKRIDVLATALRAGLRATDLKDLDLAYAPPYSSAKDPVNMAGYMAENLALGRVKQAYCEDVAALPRDGSATLLDTRTPFEYARGHAAGFVNIPLDELRGRLGEIARERPVYVMCQSGLRSYLACRILAQNGYDCYNIAGGYRFYAANLCE